MDNITNASDRRKELLLELSYKRDWKSRKAKENFRRPAFSGTILEPGQKHGEA